MRQYVCMCPAQCLNTETNVSWTLIAQSPSHQQWRCPHCIGSYECLYSCIISQPLQEKAFYWAWCVTVTSSSLPGTAGLFYHIKQSKELETLQPWVGLDGQWKHSQCKDWRLAPKPHPPMSDRVVTSHDQIGALSRKLQWEPQLYQMWAPLLQFLHL